MINKAGRQTLQERIKGFEHTPKAWKAIREETDSIAKETISLLRKSDVKDEEIFQTRDRLNNLKKAMVDNIGDQHFISKKGASWSNIIRIQGEEISAKSIGGIFGALIPKVELSLVYKGGMGAEPNSGYTKTVNESGSSSSESVNYRQRAILDRLDQGSTSGSFNKNKVEVLANNDLKIMEGFNQLRDLASAREQRPVYESFSTYTSARDSIQIIRNDQFVVPETKDRVKNHGMNDAKSDISKLEKQAKGVKSRLFYSMRKKSQAEYARLQERIEKEKKVMEQLEKM